MRLSGGWGPPWTKQAFGQKERSKMWWREGGHGDARMLALKMEEGDKPRNLGGPLKLERARKWPLSRVSRMECSLAQTLSLARWGMCQTSDLQNQNTKHLSAKKKRGEEKKQGTEARKASTGSRTGGTIHLQARAASCSVFFPPCQHTSGTVRLTVCLNVTECYHKALGKYPTCHVRTCSH